ERVRQELTIAQVRRRLRGNREPFNFYKEHDIARETLGFEFGKFLPMIRPGKDGVQKHFVVGVTVVAKDNNVERRDGPATGRFKQAPLLFLVVSGAELLGEIYKDEEEIRQKLGEVKDKLTKASTFLGEVESTLSNPAATLDNLETAKIRLAGPDGGIRDAVQTTAAATRKIRDDYVR